MQRNSFPPKKRDLSKFLAEELLFDYITSHLDSEREMAVKNAIEKDAELKDEEEGMRKALEYLEGLSKTTVSEPLIEKVTKDPSWFLVLKSSLHWGEWPDPVKWFIEAVLVSSLVAVVAVLIPWNDISLFKVSNGDVALVKEKKVTVFKPIEPEAVIESEVKPPEEKLAQVEGEKQAPAEPEKEMKVVVKKSESQVFNKVEESKPAVEKVKKKKKGNAFVYRSFMEIENTAERAPLITAIIQKYGGVKAGQVKLGWEKPDGNYFHFKLPEENYETAMREIKAFGEISSSKTEHRRVMPVGVVRVILWVKEKKIQN